MMAHIIRKEWNKKVSYYIYDNVWDEETKTFKKKYLGQATEQEYLKYLEEKQNKYKNPNYCNTCGLRLSVSLPPYMRKRVKLCQCNKMKENKEEKVLI